MNRQKAPGKIQEKQCIKTKKRDPSKRTAHACFDSGLNAPIIGKLKIQLKVLAF